MSTRSASRLQLSHIKIRKPSRLSHISPLQWSPRDLHTDASEGATASVPGSSTARVRTTDLTALARARKLDPVIGREREIQSIIEILSRRTRNNPLLIGPRGVGKAAIVSGVAERLISNSVPAPLSGKRLVSIDLRELSSIKGFEQELIEVFESNPDAVFWIDNIDLLPLTLRRGQLGGSSSRPVPDATAKSHFVPMRIKEPSVLETIEILNGLKHTYEKHHSTTISEEALVAAASLAHRYVRGGHLPVSIDLLSDAAASRPSLALSHELTVALNAHDWIRAAEIQHSLLPSQNNISAELIERLVSRMTGLPRSKLVNPTDGLEDALRRRVLGHGEALKHVRPGMRLAFVGPRGVGKMETARVLSEVIGEGDVLPFSPGFEFSELVSKVRQRPFAVVVLRDVQATPSLLKVLETLSFPDEDGHLVDFSNTSLILSSSQPLPPTLVPYCDQVITFCPLSPEIQAEIVDSRLREIQSDVSHVKLLVEGGARDFLAGRMFDLDRIIEKQVRIPLTEALRHGGHKTGDMVRVRLNQRGDALEVLLSPVITSTEP